MAILETCCFWKSVRKGSFACAFYTLIYFGFSSIMFLLYLREEQDFLLGRRRQPIGESILEKGDVTVATVIFNILFLFCSVLILFSSLLLIVGLRQVSALATAADPNKKNKRQFLLPWIVFMLCDLLIECAHLIHLSLSQRVIFDPIVGFIFTIDFFILCLNLYCLLCVISQYQAYRAQHDEEQPPLTPIVVFAAPEKRKKSQRAKVATAGEIRKNRHALAASPLVTSHHLTNISTITEEEEQQHSKCKQLAVVPAVAAVNIVAGNENANSARISEKSTPSESNAEANDARIPIITLDCNSVHC